MTRQFEEGHRVYSYTLECSEAESEGHEGVSDMTISSVTPKYQLGEVVNIDISIQTVN